MYNKNGQKVPVSQKSAVMSFSDNKVVENYSMKSKTSKIILYVVIGMVVVALFGCAYMWYRNRRVENYSEADSTASSSQASFGCGMAMSDAPTNRFGFRFY